jgi:hypothetical protein
LSAAFSKRPFASRSDASVGDQCVSRASFCMSQERRQARSRIFFGFVLRSCDRLVPCWVGDM